MKVLLVYNLHAGSGNARKMLPQVETSLNENSIDFDIQFTNFPGHGIEIVKNADLDNYDGLIAAGGDGTLFEVINGYFQNNSGVKIPVGVLPVGTGNAFARDLNLDNKMCNEAIKIIANQNIRKVDVGKFHTQGQNYYYLNILGIGFVADVTETAHKLKGTSKNRFAKEKLSDFKQFKAGEFSNSGSIRVFSERKVAKHSWNFFREAIFRSALKLFGNIAYTFGVLFRTLSLSSDRMVFEIDGQKLERECTFVEISNTRYTANFLMAPNAIIDDGLLDVTIAKKLNRRKLLHSFPKIFTGEHVHLPEIETFQAKSIKIKSESHKILSPDGELIGITPVEIECLKQAIEFYWK